MSSEESAIGFLWNWPNLPLFIALAWWIVQTLHVLCRINAPTFYADPRNWISKYCKDFTFFAIVTYMSFAPKPQETILLTLLAIDILVFITGIFFIIPYLKNGSKIHDEETPSEKTLEGKKTVENPANLSVLLRHPHQFFLIFFSFFPHFFLIFLYL